MYSKTEQRALFDLSKKLLADAKAASKSAAETRVKDLHQIIQFHEWKYYVQNDPVVSDYEYDMLFKQLEELEADYPDLLSPDSPTQRVSDDICLLYTSPSPRD